MKIRYFIFLFIFTICVYICYIYVQENNTNILLKEQNKKIAILLKSKNCSEEKVFNREKIKLYSKASVLYDVNGKRVLYGSNEKIRLPMASTTKIMTCIVAIESGMLEDVVEFSQYASSMPNVQLNATKGEKFILKDLLYSLMLESHNDSAIAIAEHIAREYLKINTADYKSFTDKQYINSKELVSVYASIMNKKAKEIGAFNTNFVTPNGLDADTHYTTALDLAKIASYAIKNDIFLKITNTKYYNIASLDGKNYNLYNRNTFLKMYNGAIGCKTGYTSKAGYCFVGAIDKNEYNLVSVVLAAGWPPNKNYKWTDTKKLMDYGVNNYKSMRFVIDNNDLGINNIKIIKGQKECVGIYINEKFDILYNEEDVFRYEVILPKTLIAPIQKESEVGICNVYLNGNIYKRFYILTKESIYRKNVNYYMFTLVGKFLNW